MPGQFINRANLGGLKLTNNSNGGNFAMSAASSTPSIVSSGLTLNVDASNVTSYPGSGATWYDLSGNSNNVTLFNTPVYSSNDGGYISFNGSNQYGSVTITQPTYYTMCVWAYIPTLSVGPGVIGSIWIGGGNAFQFNNAFTNYSVSSSTWYFVVGVQDNTIPQQKIYVNASSANTSAVNGTTVFDSPFVIGKRRDDVYSNCRVGQVMTYNRALTSIEVTQNYDATKTRFGL